MQLVELEACATLRCKEGTSNPLTAPTISELRQIKPPRLVSQHFQSILIHSIAIWLELLPLSRLVIVLQPS